MQKVTGPNPVLRSKTHLPRARAIRLACLHRLMRAWRKTADALAREASGSKRGHESSTLSARTTQILVLVAEMADALASEASAARHAGSSPAEHTKTTRL